MTRIKIKHFGPIKAGFISDDGWLDIAKVTVFTGNQGSGKSTVAKLISTFTWIEKALVRGDYNQKWFERKNRLSNQFLSYHRIENYLKSNGSATFIEYQGDAYTISYQDGFLAIKETANHTEYPLPQIMYVPAERNFIAYVKTPKELKLSSPSLQEFLTEFDLAKAEMKSPVLLPINKTEIEYDKLNDTLNLRGEGYKLKLTDSSSGFQSLVPLFMVSDFLCKSVRQQSENKEQMTGEERERFRMGIAEIWANEALTEEQRRVAISVISGRFNKTAFVNIVEEPEQNLYPISQHSMLNSLLGFNNSGRGNKLIMTTHSPYLINYLTLSAKAGLIKEQRNNALDKKILEKIDNVVPLISTIGKNELIIYEMNEDDGSIKKLELFDGLPSDDNELNDILGESNELFAQLLEIQQHK